MELIHGPRNELLKRVPEAKPETRAEPAYTSTVIAAGSSRKTKTSTFRMVGPVGALVLILTGSLVGAAPSPEVASFAKAYGTLQKLSKGAGGSREAWLRVIHSFLSINETSKDHRLANRSLFLAGKASLELYRRGGRVDDLDLAIRHLSRFSDLNRKGPYLILGLRELKEADSLKRKALDFRSQKAKDSSKAKPGQTGANDYSGQFRARPTDKGPQAATADSSATALSANQDPGQSASHRGLISPVSHPQLLDGKNFNSGSNRDSPTANSKNILAAKSGTTVSRDTAEPDITFANPLSAPLSEATGHKISPSVISAALPPTTINDGFPAKKMVSPSAKEFVIAIDPGHGGKDPGAVSQDGCLKEKDLTLGIAKRLKTTLESKNPALKVVLTRSDDRHLSLEERIALANSANADLFISIHCNAAADSTSKGIETYYLSKASSPAAMKVAARENGIPLSKMSDIEATLVDLMVTSKKSESAKLAISVHSALSRNQKGAGTPARDRGVRQAPFYVLLGAKMPAILVECAFISNKRERGKLTSPAYLASIAAKIADGAANYLKGLGEKG